MRRLLLATALAAPLFLAAPTGRAQMPVIDFAQLGEWARQLQYRRSNRCSTCNSRSSKRSRPCRP